MVAAPSDKISTASVKAVEQWGSGRPDGKHLEREQPATELPDYPLALCMFVPSVVGRKHTFRPAPETWKARQAAKLMSTSQNLKIDYMMLINKTN